jgi:hypothetical protein
MAKSHYYCHRFRKFNYQYDINIVDLRFKKTTTYGTIDCPVELLRASIVRGKGRVLMKLEQTPMYDFMTALTNQVRSESGEQLYYDYLCHRYPSMNKRSFANIKQEKKSLVESILSDTILDVGIVTRTPKHDQKSQTQIIQIHDGIHRSIIIKSLGMKMVKCFVKV